MECRNNDELVNNESNGEFADCAAAWDVNEMQCEYTTAAFDALGFDAMWLASHYIESCCTYDHDASVDNESGGGIPDCAAGIAIMGGQCEDDSVITAFGAPKGWIASKCLATCGICS